MFEVGETVYYEWIGNIIGCVVIKTLPKSNRLRVLQDNWERMLKIREVYATPEAAIKAQISSLEKMRDQYSEMIREWDEKLDELQKP